MTSPTLPLPLLRGDVIFRERQTSGANRFVAKDPGSGRFFQLGEAEHFIARQLDGSTSLEEVGRRAEERFGAELGVDPVRRFVERLAQLGLLESGDASQRTPARRVRGNLLYVRFPAFDPDRLLAWLEPQMRWLFTPPLVVGCAALVVWAFALSLGSSGLLEGGVARLQGPEILLALWVTLLGVTVVHEFAHGLTCKHFGGQVREMGFMLIYFQPALYCNVSDAWLFPERSRRLWVTFAGAFAEITIWAVATLLFHATDPSGQLHVLAWVVMATSGVKTLFNLNPLIKLDGYYLLSDALEIPNLRTRAFDHLRSRWFEAGSGQAEASPRDRRVYVLYGVLSALFSAWLLLWVSRWIGGWLLERFDALGLLAFVGLLFMMFGGRVRAWWATACAAARRAAAAPGDGRRRRRWAALALGCGAALLLLFGRVPLNVVGDFTVSPIHNHDVRAEVPGIIERVLVAEGDTVEAGQLLVALADRDLAAELEQVRAEIVERRARQRLLVAGTRAEEIAVAEAAVAKARDRLRYARHHLDRLESLHREKLSSLKQYDEAREAAAVRARELEESRRSLELLLAGARSEEIEAVAAEVSRLETRAAHLEDRLARVRIESPIAGVVTTPKLEERVGELVQAGDLVLEVHDLATVSVEIAVPEDQISEVREGQPVRLRARAAPGRELRGSVVAIAPTARASERDWEPPTITITTRVENADGGLRPRMTGTAKIGCGERSFLQLAARRISRSMGIEVWTWW